MKHRLGGKLKNTIELTSLLDVIFIVLMIVICNQQINMTAKTNEAQVMMEEAADMQAEAKVLQTVDASEVKNAFMASGDNLFHFVINYGNYRKKMDEEEKLVLFCQIATQYLDELNVEDNYQTMGNIEYPLIYSKQN